MEIDHLMFFDAEFGNNGGIALLYWHEELNAKET